MIPIIAMILYYEGASTLGVEGMYLVSYSMASRVASQYIQSTGAHRLFEPYSAYKRYIKDDPKDPKVQRTLMAFLTKDFTHMDGLQAACWIEATQFVANWKSASAAGALWPLPSTVVYRASLFTDLQFPLDIRPPEDKGHPGAFLVMPYIYSAQDLQTYLNGRNMDPFNYEGLYQMTHPDPTFPGKYRLFLRTLPLGWFRGDEQ